MPLAHHGNCQPGGEEVVGQFGPGEQPDVDTQLAGGQLGLQVSDLLDELDVNVIVTEDLTEGDPVVVQNQNQPLANANTQATNTNPQDTAATDETFSPEQLALNQAWIRDRAQAARKALYRGQSARILANPSMIRDLTWPHPNQGIVISPTLWTDFIAALGIATRSDSNPIYFLLRDAKTIRTLLIQIDTIYRILLDKSGAGGKSAITLDDDYRAFIARGWEIIRPLINIDLTTAPEYDYGDPAGVIHPNSHFNITGADLTDFPLQTRTAMYLFGTEEVAPNTIIASESHIIAMWTMLTGVELELRTWIGEFQRKLVYDVFRFPSTDAPTTNAGIDWPDAGKYKRQTIGYAEYFAEKYIHDFDTEPLPPPASPGKKKESEPWRSWRRSPRITFDLYVQPLLLWAKIYSGLVPNMLEMIADIAFVANTELGRKSVYPDGNFAAPVEVPWLDVPAWLGTYPEWFVGTGKYVPDVSQFKIAQPVQQIQLQPNPVAAGGGQPGQTPTLNSGIRPIPFFPTLPSPPRARRPSTCARIASSTQLPLHRSGTTRYGTFTLPTVCAHSILFALPLSVVGPPGTVGSVLPAFWTPSGGNILSLGYTGLAVSRDVPAVEFVVGDGCGGVVLRWWWILGAPVVDVPVVFVEEGVVFAELREGHVWEVFVGEGAEEETSLARMVFSSSFLRIGSAINLAHSLSDASIGPLSRLSAPLTRPSAPSSRFSSARRGATVPMNSGGGGALPTEGKSDVSVDVVFVRCGCVACFGSLLAGMSVRLGKVVGRAVEKWATAGRVGRCLQIVLDEVMHAKSRRCRKSAAPTSTSALPKCNTNTANLTTSRCHTTSTGPEAHRRNESASKSLRKSILITKYVQTKIPVPVPLIRDTAKPRIPQNPRRPRRLHVNIDLRHRLPRLIPPLHIPHPITILRFQRALLALPQRVVLRALPVQLVLPVRDPVSLQPHPRQPALGRGVLHRLRVQSVGRARRRADLAQQRLVAVFEVGVRVHEAVVGVAEAGFLRCPPRLQVRYPFLFDVAEEVLAGCFDGGPVRVEGVDGELHEVAEDGAAVGPFFEELGAVVGVDGGEVGKVVEIEFEVWRWQVFDFHRERVVAEEREAALFVFQPLFLYRIYG
ncbi:LOW QUALITY PROTEIN: hypothetical protein Dda_8188 [Drechslerella dactyloides]|uniref:Uncharacterized protein n=1 Tax=Drechslerella dactyloides TaxID=74499 RepID=A0AAD6ISS0_DREDA|nr:LOW QUALITY PROTEIN: hypothetical protein Dda_8188 [Drechslerella dactyloides]